MGDKIESACSQNVIFHHIGSLVLIKKGNYDHRNYRWNGVPPEKTVSAKLAK